jgi:hypothetical protein
MRPAGLSSGIDQDRQDYTVYCGDWDVGRIYQTRSGPESLRWFCSLTVNGPMTRADRVATLEEAKAQFQKSWKNLSDAARPRRSRTRASRDRTTEEEALLVAQGQASGGTERSPIAPPQERGRRANKE